MAARGTVSADSAAVSASASLAWNRQSQRNRQSRQSAESAASAVYESGRFTVQGLTEKTVGPDKGAAAAMPPTGKIGCADLSGWGARRGKSAAQIFRRTRAGRWTVQARQENSSRGCADETGAVRTQQAVLESAAPTKSAKSAESAAGADDESGRFIVLGLTKTTGGLGSRWGSGSDANSGKNRQRCQQWEKSAAQIF